MITITVDFLLRTTRLWAILLALATFADLQGHSQTGTHATAPRVVSIPVTVTNRTGSAVSGLGISNFAVSEGGQNRTLTSAVEVPPLAVGPQKTKVAFVVLDAVGSPRDVLPRARQQCLQLLEESVISEKPISLSEIDHDGLHVVHEITTPKVVLTLALLQLDSEKHFLTDRDRLKALEASSTQYQQEVANETQRLRQFRHGTIENLPMMGVFLAQLKAFQSIASALGHARGRKAVLWLTGYFPIEVNTAEGSININSYGTWSPFPVRSASIDYQRTLDLLNDASISVFAVQMTGSQRTTIGLREFAQSTGGEWIAFSDNLQNILKRVEDGMTGYYLLTFQPESLRDLKWRTLTVRVSGGESQEVRSPNGLFVFASSK